MVNPATLGDQLRAEGVKEECVDVIVQSWNTHARTIVDRLRKYTLADKEVSQGMQKGLSLLGIKGKLA